MLAIREASIGPIFGIKGGAAGGGYAQVVPMEDLNLHFTGDIHAIRAANNLLAALIDAHRLHGNTLRIDPLTVCWRRCMDMNDRSLRDVVTGLGGRVNGYPRANRFRHHGRERGDGGRGRRSRPPRPAGAARADHDRRDVRRRADLAEQIGAAGAMTVLLKDALKPNLVQTLEGQPAFVHCGPFANIAHGNNSLVADRVGLKLGDYLVTESGFASDMGMEKFFDIICRIGGIRPSAVVLVATVRALKHHGGDVDGGLAEIERGAANMARHIGIVRRFGLEAVVAVNRFPGDMPEELELVQRLAVEAGAYAAEVNKAFEQGGKGATALAEAVVAAADEPNDFQYAYPLDSPIEEKFARSRRVSTARTTCSSSRPQATRRSPSRRRASATSRSAWRRRISRSRTTRRS